MRCPTSILMCQRTQCFHTTRKISSHIMSVISIFNLTDFSNLWLCLPSKKKPRSGRSKEDYSRNNAPKGKENRFWRHCGLHDEQEWIICSHNGISWFEFLGNGIAVTRVKDEQTDREELWEISSVCNYRQNRCVLQLTAWVDVASLAAPFPKKNLNKTPQSMEIRKTIGWYCKKPKLYTPVFCFYTFIRILDREGCAALPFM